MPPITDAHSNSKKFRHPHDDEPDTAAAFERLITLPAGPERDRLRQEIVCAWMPMATRIARRFRGRGENLEDLEQVARLGLVKAVMRYNPEYGTAFASYAVPTITGEIKRHFRDHTWDMHVPRRVQELRNRVRAADHELSQSQDSRSPGVEEIAEQAELTPAEARTGMEALNSYRTLSLDTELTNASDDGYSLKDTLGDRESGYELVLQREAIREGLSELPERQKHILYLRFFRDLTQRQIAEDIGVSQMHVSRLLNRTCEQLRRRAEADSAVAA
ncbi:SigB/SigF/SigG family RNA polymerase sigma factor [Streptomyces sp. A7024]|uniref:SigB/SigF/SigG family RNA polymerase sigma factor n=1 Tax=Streptomyces coryli TaxID=1128680 RepID=A0A6G4U2A9_9ACTN|nr:SigB/SigF/SigG family RNA polymerase sigma factor [Streptomyces coryli]NGN65508.1 SigB/SigF/SigG family RNA polymerase sigma factor [Streptomyces coryli]